MASFLHSRGGITQGGLLTMVAYGIGFLLLIKRPKAAYPGATQPWLYDDAGALGIFYNITLYFNLLKQFGPLHVYYPEPLTSVMVMHPNNLAAGKGFGLHHGFKVCKTANYLGVFIEDDASKRD